MLKAVFILCFAFAVEAQAQGSINLSTVQGIQQFMAMENIDPSQIVTTNCITNGNQCTPGGQPCCFSPGMSCQSVSGVNRCMVVPAHREHIPQVSQILRTLGITTVNPLQ